MFSFRRNVHHTPFCSAVVPLILDVIQLSTITVIYDWGWGRKLCVSCDSQVRTCIQQHYRVQEMMAVRRGGRVESFSAKKCCRERMIFVCCVCVVWRNVADFQRSLLGLSRDLSHLQQRTRHFVHFSSVTWPRNFHHCIMRVAESLCASGIFLSQRTFSQSMFPSLLFRFSVFSCIKHLPLRMVACKVEEGERKKGGREREKKKLLVFSFFLQRFTFEQLSMPRVGEKSLVDHHKILNGFLQSEFQREKAKNFTLLSFTFFLLAFFTTLNHLNG